jgi:hypothetical protein
MGQPFLHGINKKHFIKCSGTTEIYAVIDPQNIEKNYVPVSGSEPLTPVVIDNTSLKYVIFSENVFLIKKIPFVISLKIDSFKIYLPFPEEYIRKKLNIKEKALLHEYENKQIQFFQVAVFK